MRRSTPAATNRGTVLTTLRNSDGLTRAEIVRYTRISPQTVSNVVRRLMADGLVRETGTLAPDGRGRPGTTLSLNPSGRFAIGVHIDPATLGVVALDLTGQTICDHYEPLPHPTHPEASLAAVASRIQAVIAEVGLPVDRLLGVGVAAPGPLDDDAGTVSPPLLPAWHSVPVRDVLHHHLRLPVTLHKDIAAAAQAHLWQAAPTVGHSFMFLYVGAGIALTVALGGQVWTGMSGNAGEVGHFPVTTPQLAHRSGARLTDAPTPECSCGRGDCLGARLGAQDLVRRGRALGLPLPDPEPAEGGAASHGAASPSHGAASPSQAGTRQAVAPSASDLAVHELVRLAVEGDRTASALMHQAATGVTGTARAVAELLDLDTLVIGGPQWNAIRPVVEPAVRSALERHTVHGVARPIRTISSPLEWRSAAVGAGCLTLSEVYVTNFPRDTILSK